MVLDSSAVVAVLLNEASAAGLADVMKRATSLAIGAPSVLEVAFVVESRRPEQGARNLDAFMADWQIEIVPFDAEQLSVAREGFRRYGRGSGSRAKLNFGDCCTYALAKTRSEPLLFVGEDFIHTDIVPAA